MPSLRFRPSIFLAIVVAAAPWARAAAQILPLTVPKGSVRFDFSGDFDVYDLRWADGTRGEAAGDFQSGALGALTIPGLADADRRIQSITGNSSYRLDLGRSAASKMVRLGTAGFGGAIGLTSRLTIFGRVPFVQVDVASKFLLDPSTANAGLNPADPQFGTSQGIAQMAAFFTELRAAIQSLSDRIASGAFSGNPALETLANETLTRAQMLDTDLTALLFTPGVSSPFTPLATSGAGAAILATLQSLQGTLSGSLGVSGFSALPVLPVTPLSAANFDDFLQRADGPIAVKPFSDTPKFSYLGDIEVGAAFALIDHFPRSTFGSGLRAALTGTVRLRTARLPDTDRLLAVGTGDRQPDVELGLTTDYATGHLGIRLSGSYNLQLPGNLQRRVTAYYSPIAPAVWTAAVRRDPGDVIRLGAQPFLRLSSYFSLFASVDYWSKGVDAFTYVTGQAPVEGTDLAVLSLGTESNAVLLAGGLSYSHSGLDQHGHRGKPMDASLRYERIASSTKGVVPDASSVRVNVRFYTRRHRNP